MKMLLRAEDLSISYYNKKIVENVSFSLNEGSWIMLAGPNGAGKTTIIKALCGSVEYEGRVSYNGRDIKTMKANELARSIGVLQQNNSMGYSFTVGEVVSLGRYAYTSGFFGNGDPAGKEMISKALNVTGMTGLVNKPATELSGGELQRMYLAQVIAQNPKILLLDEPTNHLDLIYQKQFFDIITAWLQAEEGRGVISVVHDLNFARNYGSEGILLDRGRIVAQGSRSEVFSRENLEAAYSMDVYGWMKQMIKNWE